MQVSKINNNSNFRGIIYTKCPPIKCKDVKGAKFFNISNDKNPPKQLIDIIENSKVLKDISKDTDIFVTSVHTKKGDGNIMGGIHIAFKDIYSKDKNATASINIAPTEKIETEKSFWELCANKVDKLKDFLTMKNEANNQEVSFLKDEKDKKPFGWLTLDN